MWEAALKLLASAAVVECARARSEDKPVIVVGHSLGGHVTLAAQGTGRIAADAIVAVATNVWLREFEESRLRWAAKWALARGVLAVAARAHGFPARRLRIGSDDASERYLRDVLRGGLRGTWKSADGSDDYVRSLARVNVPVAAVLGDRDLINCHPAAGEAFVRRCSGEVAVFHGDAGHMELVTSPQSYGATISAIEWAATRVALVPAGPEKHPPVT